jgi:hypothetical protein
VEKEGKEVKENDREGEGEGKPDVQKHQDQTSADDPRVGTVGFCYP